MPVLNILICIIPIFVDWATPEFYWPFGEAACKIVLTTYYSTAFVSIYTLVLISLERFLALVYPLRSINWRTNKNSLIVIISIWTVVLVLFIPLQAIHAEVKVHGNSTFCALADDKAIPIMGKSLTWQWKVLHFRIFVLIFGFVIPMICMSGIYITLLYKVWKHDKANGKSDEIMRKDMKVVKIFTSH